MIDHLGITVSDFDASKAFYDKAMAPLGASLLMVVPPEYTGGVKVGGYGRERPTFWMREGDRQRTTSTSPSRRARAPRSTPSTRRRSPLAAATMAGRGCGRCITRTTTAPSCSIPTATMSKRSATTRNRKRRTADEPRQPADLYRRLPVRRGALSRRGRARRGVDLPLPHVPEGQRQFLSAAGLGARREADLDARRSRNTSSRRTRPGAASAAIAARR